ncbi:hypothetical protein AX16_003062 [Volvariella volvacea WC 439]|nr:hypothetical protein AX16_003062 [Volvariella volvacea WC 439]
MLKAVQLSCFVLAILFFLAVSASPTPAPSDLETEHPPYKPTIWDIKAHLIAATSTIKKLDQDVLAITGNGPITDDQLDVLNKDVEKMATYWTDVRQRLKDHGIVDEEEAKILSEVQDSLTTVIFKTGNDILSKKKNFAKYLRNPRQPLPEQQEVPYGIKFAQYIVRKISGLVGGGGWAEECFIQYRNGYKGAMEGLAKDIGLFEIRFQREITA